MERVVADLVVRAHRVNGLPRGPERAAVQIAVSGILGIVSTFGFAFISKMNDMCQTKRTAMTVTSTAPATTT